jgi:dipeptidyl aminopeptidase/acylaminoacyl peptidase
MAAFTAEDLFRYQELGQLALAPDGRQAICRVKSIDREKDQYESKLWLFAVDGTGSRQFTTGASYDDYPKWSPDGAKVAFFSDRTGSSSQIHIISPNGGEAHALSNLPLGGISLAWSPDGTKFLVTGMVQVDPEARGERRGKVDARPKDAPQIVWRLPYKKDGTGYELDREIHLFIVDAVTGEHTQITDGPFDVRSAAWSPDGKRVVFARTREERAAHCTDIWVAHADGTKARRLSHDVSTAQFPKWSPDGRWVVFSGSEDEGDAQVRLWRIDMQTQDVSALGDESIEVVSGDGVQWASDSSSVTVVIARRGRQVIVKVGVPDGKVVDVLAEDAQVSEVASSEKRIAYISQTAISPARLYVREIGTTDSTRLDELNAWWSERDLPTVEIRQFKVPKEDGGTEQVEGWVLRPKDAKGPRPLLVDVHGGPASYVLTSYDAHSHWLVLCSQGWVVLALNSVGSSSYGRDFAHRLRGRWGKADLDQHLAAAEQLCKDGVCDRRWAISGKSYGGYLSSWAIGQTDRFGAAVTIAPVSNLETHYGTSDSGYYADPYSMYGEPFINRERTRELSPMQHVEKARTPTLILQGTDDERCPKCQAEELFVTLMRASDTPTELVLYPGGSHRFLEEGKPSHRCDAVTRITGWVKRWAIGRETKQETSTERADQPRMAKEPVEDAA